MPVRSGREVDRDGFGSTADVLVAQDEVGDQLVVAHQTVVKEFINSDDSKTTVRSVRVAGERGNVSWR